MTDEKRKPGRPRKWSSDAERMRATRAAKRAEREAEENRLEAKRLLHEVTERQRYSKPPKAKSAAAKNGNTWKAVHATCEANITKLREELRTLEDEYDDSVYDRWILEHQYRMAVTRMQERDPEGLVWLDDQVQRWEARREGFLEDRRRLRLGGRTARHPT